MRGCRLRMFAALGCFVIGVSAAAAGGCHEVPSCPPGVGGVWGCCPQECCRSSYSPTHYWAPTMFKCAFQHRHPLPSESYPSDCFTNLPPTYQILPFPCRSAAPAHASPYGTLLKDVPMDRPAP